MIKKIIGLAIAIILTGAVLVPVISEASGEETLDVYVLAGQSNAAYNTNPARCDVSSVREHVEAPTVTAWYYGTEATPIINGTTGTTPSTYDPTFESYDLHQMFRGGEWQIGGEEPALASAIGKRSNNDILIINVGVNNQKIAQLQPTATQGIYVDEVITHAMDHIDHSRYPNVHTKGVIWIQGESDNSAGTPIASYVSGFESLKTWYSEKGFSKWYMVQIRPYNGTTATEAQAQIAASDRDVELTTIAQTFTVANGLMSSDDLHYSQEGRTMIGETVGAMVPKGDSLRGGTADLLGVLPLIIIVSFVAGAASIIILRRD